MNLLQIEIYCFKPTHTTDTSCKVRNFFFVLNIYDFINVSNKMKSIFYDAYKFFIKMATFEKNYVHFEAHMKQG
jgi:hypothetical protein